MWVGVGCYFELVILSKLNPCMTDYIFILLTGIIAWHGLTYRDEEGESEIGHLLFGAIALLFFFRVLLVDILELV